MGPHPALACASRQADGGSPRQRGSQFRRVGHENHLLDHQIYQLDLPVLEIERCEESDNLPRNTAS
jgi:hypothetical protein